MDQLLKFVNNLNSAQRAVIVGGFSVLFVFLIGLLVYSNIKAEDEKLGYTIATNLTKNQVMMASSELEASGIPFAIIGSGNSLTLKTSKEFVNVAKVKLVTSEASTTQHTGWEIFEKSSLGTTNFENKIKYLRALEGELSRSLEGLNGVLKADVKIGVPKETVFVDTKTLPTASAVLTLRPGVYLTQKQIEGIKNFISSAIPDLKSENIKLIDQDGTLLEKTKDDMESGKLTTQEKYKENLEKKLEDKIVALLEPFVGAGRVVARVSADLEFKRTESREEIYQPEGTMRSQQTEETTTNSEDKKEDAGATPGVQQNIQAGANAENGVKSKSSKEEAKNTTNFEISNKVINQKDDAFASIKKISAAVTFDSTVLEQVADRQVFIDSLNKIIQDTIGYDQQRGDQVSVRDFKFLTAGTTSGATADTANEASSVDTVGQVKSALQEFGEYVQYIIAAILLFIFYKKFISNNEIILMAGDSVAGAKKTQNSSQASNLDVPDFENEFDTRTANSRLKAKVRSQLANNIEGMDEEEAAKYEVLIEELDKFVNNSPQEVASIIELLLSEGDTKLRGKRKS